MTQVSDSTSVRPVPQATALTGEAHLPANRDIVMMGLVLGARSTGITRLLRAASHPDTDAFVDNLARLGIDVSRDGDTLSLGSEDGPLELSASEDPLDAGESRVHFACLAGLLASAPFPQTIRYSGSRTEAAPIIQALEALDVRIQQPREEATPFEVTLGGRRPKPGTARIDPVDEAVKAAVLLAGLGVDGDTVLYQPGAGDDTIEPLFRAAGSPVEKERVSDEEGYRLTLSGPPAPQGAEHDLPGDPDAALYLLLTSALLPRSEVTFANVGVDWKSRRIVEVLRRMNADLSVERARSGSRFPLRKVVAKGSELRATRIAAELAECFLNEIPFMALAVAGGSGEAIFRDAQALRNGHEPQNLDEAQEGDSSDEEIEDKGQGENGAQPDASEETTPDADAPGDTLAIAVSALRELGVKVGEMPDGLVLQGGQVLQGTTVDAAGDHRVAVALMLAGMAAEGSTAVRNPGAVDAYDGPVLSLADSLAQKRSVKE